MNWYKLATRINPEVETSKKFWCDTDGNYCMQWLMATADHISIDDVYGLIDNLYKFAGKDIEKLNEQGLDVEYGDGALRVIRGKLHFLMNGTSSLQEEDGAVDHTLIDSILIKNGFSK